MTINDPRNIPDDAFANENQVEQTAEAPGNDVTAERLVNDRDNPRSWLHYNKGVEGVGYSPADRINRDNVTDLSQEWTKEGDIVTQVNPIVVPSGDGEPPVLYYSTALQQVVALNARTGEEYWRFQYSPEYGGGLNRGGTQNRGVAVYGDKVYLKAADVRVVALDRYTGEQQWTSHAVSERQEEEMIPSTQRLGSTAAPLAYDGKILGGQSGGGGGWGAMNALDAETGERLWSVHTIDFDDWVNQSWRFGDGNMWMTPSVDPDTGIAYFPTGNPAPQIQAAVRPGPNKRSDSVVAVDTETGDIEWEHQLIAHDWWDYDNYFNRIFEMEVGGETRKVVQAEDKTGWVYFIDAETGQLVMRSEPYANQGAEHLGGMEFLGVPPAGEENKQLKSPTGMGATEWHPDGYSPQTGLLYLASMDDYRYTWYEPDWKYHLRDIDSHDDIGGGKEVTAVPGEKTARVVAIRPETGELVWRTPYESDREVPTAGGNTPTAGNLVFGGNHDGTLRALDAETGDILWKDQNGLTHEPSPVIWDDPEEGKQYVSVAADQTIITYALGD